jgi:hypothetical protein
MVLAHSQIIVMMISISRSFVSLNPFFGGYVVILIDIIDLFAGSIDLSTIHKLDFDVFLNDSSLGSEQDDAFSFLNVFSSVKESLDDTGLITQSDSSSLSDFLDAQNLK